MMSALVLVADAPATVDADRAREIVIRSLGWLVSAVVEGVVGDVVLAAPSRLDLGEAADLAGCGFVEAGEESDRLRLGVAACRKGSLIVMRSGFAADAALIDALDRVLRDAPRQALIRAMPETLLQRLMPRLGSVVGVVLPREPALHARSFDDLVRSTRRMPHRQGRAFRLS